MFKIIKEFWNVILSLIFWKRLILCWWNCESLIEIKFFYDVVDYVCKGLRIVGDSLVIYFSLF